MYHYSWCLIKFRTISTRFISLFFVACCLPSSRLLSCHHVSSHRVTVFHHVLAGLISSHVFSLNLVNLLKCCTSTHWNWCFNIFFFMNYFSPVFIVFHHASSCLSSIHHHITFRLVSSRPINRTWSHRMVSCPVISFHKICNHFPHLSSSISSTQWNPIPPLPHCKIFVHPSAVSNWVCGAGPEVALALCDAVYARMGISWVQVHMKKIFQHLGGNHPNLLLTLVRFPQWVTQNR